MDQGCCCCAAAEGTVEMPAADGEMTKGTWEEGGRQQQKPATPIKKTRFRIEAVQLTRALIYCMVQVKP